MIYEIKPIIIKTKTNLHVGDGSTNFDIVDKSVQRDTISKLPVINASSLKGALKDFMYNMTVEKSNNTYKLEKDAYRKIFGDDSLGLIKFLDSYLLFLPLRSNKKPYFHTTSKENLLNFISFYKDLGYEEDKFKEAEEVISQLEEDVLINCDDGFVEDFECKRQDIDINKILEILPDENKPENIAILSNENFIEAVTHLPVIARNKIAKDEDKKDSNLWYEEIVPRESIFYTAMLDYNNFGKNSTFRYKEGFKVFFNILQEYLIQVGSNASVGFGLCSFKIFFHQEKQENQGEKNE